nr:SusC/RagA family TonB-linked outer membrane protein [Odoribacter splanchnicus]
MKLTVFLILLGLLRVSAVTNAQVYRINLELENVACEEAIESLKGQTNLDFFFSNREVNVNRKVSVSCKNASLEEALKQILGEGYSFRLIDNTVVIRPVKNQLPQPKQVTVKGTVKDVKGNPLPGVTVLLKGSALGISTDNDGKFTVSFPEMKDVVLLFSFIGMKSQEVKYTGQTDIKVVLEEDVKEMDEVIVTGIMERKAESFTGSATVVKGDDLKRVGNTNIFQSLKNLDPTVFVMDNLDMGSNPNALPEMNMRGGTSFPGGEIDSDLKGNYENKPNQPLFILDGFEVSAETVFDLDMQRVESLTILKDASAKAIYGSKAANGVVVIETKRLDSNKPRFSYTGSLDLNMPDLSSYDLCNALEKLDVEFTEGVYDVNNPNDMKKYYALCKKALEGLDTYWLSKPVQFGYGHKHSLMIELGKDELRTSLNFSYSNNVGIMKKSGRENLSGAFNLQYNP